MAFGVGVTPAAGHRARTASVAPIGAAAPWKEPGSGQAATEGSARAGQPIKRSRPRSQLQIASKLCPARVLRCRARR